jgi:hypothetical protein
MPFILGDVLGEFLWVISLLRWLTSPSVIPWLGMAAAVVASLTIRPKDWLTSPQTFIIRTLQVAVVWLILISLLGLITPGDGEGKEGTSTGPESGPSDDGDNSDKPGPEVNVTQFLGPIGGYAEDLTVRFVRSEANETRAQKFACDVIYSDEISGGKRNMKQITIRARDMKSFDALLVKQLRDFKATTSKPRVSVRVEDNPFPGESVIRKVKDKIRSTLEDCDIKIGVPE